VPENTFLVNPPNILTRSSEIFYNEFYRNNKILDILPLRRILLSYILLFSTISISVESKDTSIIKFVKQAEIDNKIPNGLLLAIIQVESQARSYAVNVAGKAYYFKTKEDAERFINNKLKAGHKNISIGCSQILYAVHKRNFKNSVSEMLDPKNNIQYSAKLLKKLYNKHKNWEMAVRRYHSSTFGKSTKYCSKVEKKLGRSI
jgi:soluble lytic murein transglycosylase-like protein